METFMRISEDNSLPLQFRTGFAGLYIHFPFCIQKCEYCDFFSIGNGTTILPEEREIFLHYKKELDARLKEYPGWLEKKFDTIFFGGGTPSRMDLASLENLLDFLRKKLPIQDHAEISLEANPEDITSERLKSWYDMGINRVNMGYQTTHKHHLDGVGRFYDHAVYKKSPEILASSPISRYGFDLIYGFPGETWDEFTEDLDFLLGFSPRHMSIYSLTMEKGTSYSRKVKEGIRNKPEEDLQEKIFQNLPDIMENAGFEWYEISNFALSDQVSHHNLKYWMYEPYLALGPGASGFTGRERYTNPRNLEKYKNNFGKMEKSDFLPEWSLGIFRILLPIHMESFLSGVSPSAQNLAFSVWEEWDRKKLCKWDHARKIFQWNPEGVIQLDSLVLEFLERMDHS